VTLGAAHEAGHHVNSRVGRHATVAVFVGAWMLAGFVLGLDANTYLLVGGPIDGRFSPCDPSPAIARSMGRRRAAVAARQARACIRSAARRRPGC